MSSRVRKYGDSIEVSVDTYVTIQIEDVIDRISDEALLEELEIRGRMGLRGPQLEDFEEVLDLMKRRELDRAEWLLDRILHPKYRDVAQVQELLKKAKPAP